MVTVTTLITGFPLNLLAVITTSLTLSVRLVLAFQTKTYPSSLADSEWANFWQALSVQQSLNFIIKNKVLFILFWINCRWSLKIMGDWNASVDGYGVSKSIDSSPLRPARICWLLIGDGSGMVTYAELKITISSLHDYGNFNNDHGGY